MFICVYNLLFYWKNRLLVLGWAGSIGAYKTPCFDHFQQSEYTFLDYLFSVQILGLKLDN